MTPIKVDPKHIWQTSDLDYCIAEELFGWRWLAYMGRPTRSHPDYPKEMRVRRFYPPMKDMGSKIVREQWEEHFQQVPHEPATGDEPLCYSYCSSNGSHRIPHFSGHWEAVRKMEIEIERRGLFEEYEKWIAGRVGAISEEGEITDRKKVRAAGCEERCIAALATVGSKYVTTMTG